MDTRSRIQELNTVCDPQVDIEKTELVAKENLAHAYYYYHYNYWLLVLGLWLMVYGLWLVARPLNS
ncbi:hypothetical protein VXE41_20790, partial [Acinetobacter variabilis]